MIDRRRLLFTAGAAIASGPARAATAAEPCDVVVAGAGLAGLYAARLLSSQGARVVVLEQGPRVGGRLKTLDNLPGAPEAGGQTLDSMYARVLREMGDLGLTTVPRKSFAEGDAVYINGALSSGAGWASSPGNRLAGEARAVSPGRLYAHYVDRANPIPGLTEWRDPAHAGLDRASLAQALEPLAPGAEALRLMQLWFDGPPLDRVSALFAYRKRMVETFGAGGPMMRIRGGSQRLPEAMAANLGEAVRLDSPVAAIIQDEAGVEMRTADGRRVRGRFGLCALPYPAVRKVRLDPAPPKLLAEAIGRLPYSTTIMVTLVVRRPYWEADGLPPAMYLDTAPQRLTATAAQAGGLPTVCSWVRGRAAAALLAGPRDAIGSKVLAELEAARPAVRGALEVGDVTVWGPGTWAGGAYHAFDRGQIGRLFEPMRQPHGRLRFIGEHMADLQQGMEGACESAEREALALLEVL